MTLEVLVWTLAIFTFHYIADFLCQNNWMAINKATRWDALALHVTIYSAVFTVLFGWQFGAITFVCHFLTDALTSRLNVRLFFVDYKTTVVAEGGVFYRVDWEKRKLFFDGIGVDQLMHHAQLLVTLWWVKGGLV